MSPKIMSGSSEVFMVGRGSDVLITMVGIGRSEAFREYYQGVKEVTGGEGTVVGVRRA